MKRGSAVCRMATATSRLASRVSLDVSAMAPTNVASATSMIVRLRAFGERSRRRDANTRVGIGNHRARECGRILVTDDGQRADCCGADPGVRISQHAADVRRPALARCRDAPRPALPARVRGPPATRDRGAAASRDFACRAIPTRRWRIPRVPDPDAPAPGRETPRSTARIRSGALPQV